MLELEKVLEVAFGVLPIPATSLVGDATVIPCVELMMTVVVMSLPQCFIMVCLI